MNQPAQQSKLGKEASGFLPFLSSPDIGLYLRASTTRRPKNSAAILKNLHFDGISWTPEDTGFGLHRADAFNAGEPFKEFGVHYLDDDSSKFVAQVGTKVYDYNPAGDPDIETEVELFEAGAETTPCMTSFKPIFFIYCNGVDQPQKWDGTDASGWGALTGFPVTIGADEFSKPRLCCTFQGRLATARFETQPYAVVLSKFDDPEDYDVTGTSDARAGVLFVPSALGPVTSLLSTKLDASTNEEILIIGCQNGLAIVTGTGANDFERVVVTRRFGIVNNRCWLNIDDDYLVLATDGIRRLSTNTNFSNLINTTLTYPIHDLMQERNSAVEFEPFVIDNPERLEAVFYFPRGSEVRNRQGVICNYSMLNQGYIMPSVKEYPTGDSGAGVPACGINYRGIKLCGSYTGLLQRHWQGDFFGSAPITWQYLSPTADSPTPLQESSVHSVAIKCEGGSQYFRARWFVYVASAITDALRRVLSYEKTFTSDMDGDTVIGEWQLGVDAFGGASFQQFSFNPKHAGRSHELELSGDTGLGLVNFSEWFATLIAGGLRH